MRTPLRQKQLLFTAAFACSVAQGQASQQLLAEADGPALATSLFAPVAPAARTATVPRQQADAAAASQPVTPISRYRVQHPSTTDVLHLTAGHSLVLHGAVPMKRVYVGDPTVLSSFNSSPTDLLLTGKSAGVTSLAVWDTNGTNQLYTVSVDLDPFEMQSAVNQMYPDSDIEVTGVGERLELNGSVPTQEISDSVGKLGSSYAKQVANSLRILPVMPKQVELKLQIVEVDRTKLDQFAVNFTRTGNTPTSTGTGAFTNPLNLSIGYLKESFTLNVQALAQQSVLQILAEPTLTTLSGGVAKFLSGGEFPIPVVQGTATGGASATVTIQFRPYGVKVDFLPIVEPDGSIRLKVAPEVSTLDYANAVTISGFTVPALSTRRADTEIQLRNGQSFVLSGLLDHRAIESLGRVPGISRIPYLGELFKSRNNTHSLTELVFVVTANVIDPSMPQPDMPRPKPVSPFITEGQFDNEVNKKQISNPNR